MASKARGRTAGKAPAVSPPGGRSSVRRSWLWLGLFAAGMLVTNGVYAPALHGPLIFDDYNLPFNNPNAAKMPAAFWIGGVRPVLMASYWVNYLISGTDTFLYHAVNLLLHSATAVIVFFLFQRILKLAGYEEKTFIPSLFGAGLFLLHPLQSESVAYIAGRSELVSGLFLLSAWLVFLNHFENNTSLATALKILLLATIALLGKESAISLPGVLLITDLYWKRASLQAQIRSRIRLYLPIILGGVVAAAVIIRSLGGASGAGLSLGVTPFQYALTQCRAILIYISLFLIPIGQSGDWQLPLYRTLADTRAWLYMFGMLALLAGIMLSYRRAPLFSFGLAAFLVLLMPTSSVLPIKDALAERRMYVPIIGLILALLGIVNSFRLDSALLRLGAIVLLTTAAGLTYQRSRIWGDDIVFWQDVIRGNPSNSRAHLGLGGSYMNHRRFAEAIKEYDLVGSLAGPQEDIILNRIVAYEYNGNFDLALDGLHKLAAMHPTASTYHHIGHVEAYLRQAKEALAAFDLALSLDPNYVPALVERGRVRVATGDYQNARADFQRALEIEPDNGAAVDGLAKLVGR